MGKKVTKGVHLLLGTLEGCRKRRFILKEIGRGDCLEDVEVRSLKSGDFCEVESVTEHTEGRKIVDCVLLDS
jgi:hypothetical protein